MELLDRYLQAVKKHLPWERQDDIIAELRANLESQLEDREEEIGRPLTDAEVEVWLKELGPPIQVAGRYQKQQYLIGPAVFPTYLYVLRMAALWVVIIYSVISAVQLAFESPYPTFSTVLGVVFRFPGILLTTAAWITLVFAALEFVVTHYPEMFTSVTGVPANWTPSALPMIEKFGDSVNASLQPDSKPRRYAHAVAEVVFNYIGLAWLILVPHYPFLLFGPAAYMLAALPVQVPHVWVEFYWCVLTLGIVQTAWRTWALWSGAWRKPFRVITIAWKLIGLTPVLVLLTAPGQALILLTHPEVNRAHYGATIDTINRTTHMAMQIVCVIVVLHLVWEIFQYSLEAYRERVA
jgi:hypothetical protein